MWAKFLKTVTLIGIPGSVILGIILGVKIGDAQRDHEFLVGLFVFCLIVLTYLIECSFIMMFIDMVENIEQIKKKVFDPNGNSSNLINSGSDAVSRFISDTREKWECSSCGYINYDGIKCKKCGHNKIG